MREQLDRSLFLKEVKTEFPQLRDELNAEQGLLSFEVEVFYRFTQNMINKGDSKTVASCFAIAEKYYLQGNPKLKDAIDTCFVENLEFSNTKKRTRQWAWTALPHILKALYRNFND